MSLISLKYLINLSKFLLIIYYTTPKKYKKVIN